MNRIVLLTEKLLTNMNYYSSRIGTRFIRKEKPVYLGRWNLVYDERVLKKNERVFKKNERANEDHCGPCGQLYLNEKPNK